MYKDLVNLNRKSRVENELSIMTQSIVCELAETNKKIGFSANEIAIRLKLVRSNVSKELNCLLGENKAIKISGKPVLYLATEVLQKTYGNVLNQSVFQSISQLQQCLCPDQDDTPAEKEISQNFLQSDLQQVKQEKIEKEIKHHDQIFGNITGAEDDLQLQVKQAKAAILYPPNGLHTLIIGPTGSGKTTFAGIMYRYAIDTGKMPSTASYVIFNCADYAENSQLLISHLFGHVKGAYTGAERERRGLIDQADGGILFLDEIHRLPPEGQEMLFSLIDRGTYRRLGEAEGVRTANVLIIAATTEDPQSAILGTFLRRIPLVITLPGLNERNLKVRMKLICQFFREESVKIKVPLMVAKEVLKVLLLYKCPGNIGQLRNDIQLICANAFVEYITNQQNGVQIKLSQLSQNLKEGFFAIDEKRQELMQNFNLNDCETIIFDGMKDGLTESLHNVLLYDEYQTGEDFYDLILESAQKLYKEGLEVDQIKDNIAGQVQKRMYQSVPKARANNLHVDKEVLSKIATPEIVRIIEEELEKANAVFGRILDAKMVYSLALHMETLIERLRQGEVRIYPNSIKVSSDHPEEYRVAMQIKVRVEKALNVIIPSDEAAFIAMALYSMNIKKEGNIQILVLSHGISTATNMVEVAKMLLGYDCLHALDMPMEEKVTVTLNKAVELVKRINTGGGVLLLVDMGSLTTFSEVITSRTGIPTRTIRMVSTPMVIEAARKAMMTNMTLEELEESVITMSGFIGGRVKVAVEEEIQFEPLKAQTMSYSHGIITMLEDVLAFLNVKKACRVLDEVLDKIAADCNFIVDDTIHLKFLFHCSCMIERLVRKEPLPYKKFARIKEEHQTVFQFVEQNFEVVEEIFGILIPETEIAYIVEMLNTHFYHTGIDDSILKLKNR
ncbi:sigma-54-dependent transcriptional regulator [Anaerosinus sp.]|uniref:sigma-54-dependent transcriptional regulator n=1 Tax=Selenobaculum sp. TaxID=3074374 RepID=UPI003AB47BF0